MDLANVNPQGFIEEKISDIGTTLVQWLISLTDKILAVAAIAIIGYIVYQAVKLMWFGKSELTQKALFGYFALLLVRLLSALVKVGG